MFRIFLQRRIKMKEQTGTFDIIDGIPIVFAHGLLKPDVNDYSLFQIDLFTSASKQYESSRQEWGVKNITDTFIEDKTGIIIISVILNYVEYLLKGKEQIRFTEIQSSENNKRGKCKITKIIENE